jgi:hypothetical protein
MIDNYLNELLEAIAPGQGKVYSNKGQKDSVLIGMLVLRFPNR